MPKDKKRQTAKGLAAKALCEAFPKTSSNALAKKLYEENKHLFDDLEDARYKIRYYRGEAGVQNRRLAKNTYGKYRIPRSASKEHKPLILGPEDNHLGILSDLHIPNHRPRAIEVALDDFKEHKVNTIIINGDLLDNTPFSKWAHRPPGVKDVKRWFDMAEDFLAMLRREFPKARILWLEGNHDHWYYLWLIKKAAILFGDEYFHLDQRLNLAQYDIEFVPQERYVMAGKLAICHGHHLVKGVFAPVNAARGAYMKAKADVLIGHLHSESSHTESNMHGESVTTYSVACLCTLTPDYQPFGGKSCHGAARVVVGKRGFYRVFNYRIEKGRIK